MAADPGVIVLWSAPERVLGHPPADGIGQTLAVSIPPAARPAFIVGFRQAVASGRMDTDGPSNPRRSS